MDANGNLEAAVRAELASDPRIPYVDEIAIAAEGTTVILSATVCSFARQRAGVADARRAAVAHDGALGWIERGASAGDRRRLVIWMSSVIPHPNGSVAHPSFDS